MTNEKLHVQLDRLREVTGGELSYDKGSLLEDYHEERDNEGTLGMKVLAILGAFLATGCFLAFIFVSGVYDSLTAIGITGAVFLGGGWALCHRSTKGVMASAFGVSLTVVGFVLFLIGFVDVVNSETGMGVLTMLLALVMLALHDNKILVFLAVIAAAGSTLFLLHDGFYTDGAHVYVILFALLLTAWLQKEASLIKSSKFINIRYDGIRAGLALVLLMGAYYLSDFRWWESAERAPNWYASVVLIPLAGYVGWGLLQRFVTDPAEKALYAAGILALLLPTFFAPALSAALLLLLLSWKVGYHTGTALAVVALIYFVSRYYYDLNLTLLTKSIVMMVSGTLFLIAFVLLRKKLSPQ